MGTGVYANGSAIACKAGDGKVIASFPDVCMSPPSPPAGPIPVPYPNTSFSKDMTNGSKKVKIKNKEVMLKNKSFYKSSPLGNEAATRSFGANVVSHVITGKTYFTAWSMDVKFEGKNVPRHKDFTTSNHGSYPAGAALPNPDLEVQTALAQIAEKACPCCSKKGCEAAFTEDEQEQALGFKEFYKFDSKPHRQAEFDDMMLKKSERCNCEPGNEVFPQAPCDVFREPNDKRTKRIEAEWQQQSKGYREKHNLKSQNDFAQEILNQHPDANFLKEILAFHELRKGDELLKYYKEQVADPAAEKARVNHKVPKEAGGCPGTAEKEGNLQPQQNLCEVCQEIDTFMTNNWQGPNR